MPRYITKVIRLWGDNKYREGRVERDIRPYNATKRANNYIRRYIKNIH